MSRRKKAHIIYDSSRGNGDFDEGFPPPERIAYQFITEESTEPVQKPTGNVRNRERGEKFKQAVMNQPPTGTAVVPIKPAIKQSVQSTGDYKSKHRSKSKK